MKNPSYPYSGIKIFTWPNMYKQSNTTRGVTEREYSFSQMQDDGGNKYKAYA